MLYLFLQSIFRSLCLLCCSLCVSLNTHDHHTDAKILEKMRRKEYNEPWGKADMWYCTTLYLFISHTVWNLHLNTAAWGYHTAWASAHLIPMLGLHPCSPAVHDAGTGHQCLIYLSVSPPDNYSKEEVISCSGLSHVTRKHNGLCFLIKKQQDVGIREEVGGNERNELEMFFKHVPLKCCWSWSVCIRRWRN